MHVKTYHGVVHRDDHFRLDHVWGNSEPWARNHEARRSSVSLRSALLRTAEASYVSGTLKCSCHAFTNLVKGTVKAVRHARNTGGIEGTQAMGTGRSESRMTGHTMYRGECCS